MKARPLFSLLLCLCLLCSLAPGARAAADQTAVQSTVQALGIMTGDQNGNLNLGGYVTRAQFAKMLVAASPYRDSVGDDTGYSLFKDVKRGHWASEYIRIAVEQKWFIGYADGTFRPDSTIRLEEAATVLLRLLGYSNEDLTGVYPAAQISKYRALGLDEGVSAGQGALLTRRDCMYLFYNLMTAQTKGGQVYAVSLGYSLTPAGELDYAALVAADLRGPYTLLPGAKLPYTSNVTVYRNGQSASPEDAKVYDVYYYNDNIRTVYLYSNAVTGTYTAAAPSTVSPSQVTVAGNTYSVSTSAAAYKLSAMGEFALGDTVTLLLGMDGGVADVIASGEVTSLYYGVVLSNGNESYTTEGGVIQAGRTVQVACTDGVVRSYTTDSAISVGAVVSVGWTGTQSGVRRLNEKGISGKVSARGIGETLFAPDVEILDTNTDGGYRKIYPARLAGTTLSASHVRSYVTDSDGRITHLILKDATGDLYSYGLLTAAEESSGGMNVSGSYRFLVNGQPGSYASGTTAFNVSTGGVRIAYKDGQVSSIRNLSQGTVSALTATQATVGGKTYALAEDVQVYLRDGSEYSLVNLNTVMDHAGYRLTAWYDGFGHPAGGLVRVIVAAENTQE